MIDDKERNIANNCSGVTVQASPFNGIKLFIWLIIFSIPVAWVIAHRIAHNNLLELVVLFIYSGGLALGLYYWIRQILQRKLEN